MFAILEWEAVKDWLSGSTGLTRDAYHLLLGIGLTLGLTWLLRRPLGSWLPLLIVLALELVNEAFDFTRYHVAGWPWEPGPTLVDIALTIAPPLVIVVTARLTSPCFSETPSTSALANRREDG